MAPCAGSAHLNPDDFKYFLPTLQNSAQPLPPSDCSQRDPGAARGPLQTCDLSRYRCLCLERSSFTSLPG